jgi:hypothetical protein
LQFHPDKNPREIRKLKISSRRLLKLTKYFVIQIKDNDTTSSAMPEWQCCRWWQLWWIYRCRGYILCFGDIFGGHFGGFGGFSNSRGGGGRRVNRGSDLRVKVKLNLSEVANGVEKKLKVKKVCSVPALRWNRVQKMLLHLQHAQPAVVQVV